MLSAKNTLELLQKSEAENLYQKLIVQLNKDFQLSNLTYEVAHNSSPVQLKEKLHTILLHLINNQYDDYLNFLYRVDVPEKELIKVKESTINLMVEEITFLVLKRIFQKVWLKKHF
jgi:GH15 family glucan-1,4-alpha-glucosidase